MRSDQWHYYKSILSMRRLDAEHLHHAATGAIQHQHNASSHLHSGNSNAKKFRKFQCTRYNIIAVHTMSLCKPTSPSLRLRLVLG